MRHLGLIIGFVISTVLISCGPTPEFSEHHVINNEGWADEPVTFNILMEEIGPTYELQLVIDHTTSYRYQNLYFNIVTSFPDREAREEQLTVDLADKKGNWLGDCSATKCKTKVYLLESFKFPAKGEYGFELRQYTREASLAGVNGLELNLFKLDE